MEPPSPYAFYTLHNALNSISIYYAVVCYIQYPMVALTLSAVESFVHNEICKTEEVENKMNKKDTLMETLSPFCLTLTTAPQMSSPASCPKRFPIIAFRRLSQ